MPIRAHQRRTSGLGLVLSIAFHAIVVGGLAFVAAREGLLGQPLRRVVVTIAPRRPKPEPPARTAPRETAPSPTRPSPAPVAETPSPKRPPAVSEIASSVASPTTTAALQTPASSPGASAGPSTAEPSLAGFGFGSGNVSEVEVDPGRIYRAYVEHTLRSSWRRPTRVGDSNFVAMVNLAIDPEGRVTTSDWQRGSGDAPWDDSVRDAVRRTRVFGRPPPDGFPSSIRVRFDVRTPDQDPNP